MYVKKKRRWRVTRVERVVRVWLWRGDRYVWQGDLVLNHRNRLHSNTALSTRVALTAYNAARSRDAGTFRVRGFTYAFRLRRA